MDIGMSQLKEIALASPQLALILAKEQPVLRPVAFEVKATFVSGEMGAAVESAFEQRVFNDCWIQRVQYTVQRPNYAIGSPLRAFFEEQNKRSPSVDVLGKIDCEETWDFTRTPVPIETVFGSSGDTQGFMAFNGVVIPARGSPWMRFCLTRPLSESEIPYIVRVVFSVLEMKGSRYGSITKGDAITELRAMGIYCGGLGSK